MGDIVCGPVPIDAKLPSKLSESQSVAARRVHHDRGHRERCGQLKEVVAHGRMWNDILEDCFNGDVPEAFSKLVFHPQHMFEEPTGCTLGTRGVVADTGEVWAGWSGCDNHHILLSLKLCPDVLYYAFDVELGDVSHGHRRECLGHELDTRGIDLPR